ncbi:MAG: carbamoyltransferase HypF [candidate division Zixibacteria bacterium]|nr:carbamoyltransferase HypF [candidate division Zixibacteria bacterium]
MDRQTSIAGIELVRVRFVANGVVQGVGFRPFVYRIATSLGLAGHVNNSPDGVVIEIEGTPASIAEFEMRLGTGAPPPAKIVSLISNRLGVTGENGFRIKSSRHDSPASTLIAPDIATCDDCLSELFDPQDRRYHYPFINCTNCGPRYTIIRSIPYDRPFTSMSLFPFCPDCRREYDDPSNRRFHAQPNACPVCGPKVALSGTAGAIGIDDPISTAVDLLREGKILAIRGVGGYHLAVDATKDTAVRELRRRKGRAEKPLALMAPDLGAIERVCEISDTERELLLQPSRPIVLLRRREESRIGRSVAPGQRYLGYMLPYTPLHHLLLRGNFDALLMTSGNYSEEPIAIGNDEARERLAGMADHFLTHDREILQRCDDSIMRVQHHQPRVIRRSRGMVPLPIKLRRPTMRPILAVGGELKNCIALSRGNEVFLSQHIGDLDNPSAFQFFEASVAHLSSILQIKPELIAYDLHPDYLSSQWAQRQPLPSVSVQHHHAHLASVLAENQYAGKAIGILLDGTGYGTDGTIWGGEILIGDAFSFERFAWFEPVPMPGAGMAISRPYRMAIAQLYHSFGENARNLDLPIIQNHIGELDLLAQMISKKINSPRTSSCGRLFDAVAAILGFDREIGYEAQAAIELEMICDRSIDRLSPLFQEAVEQSTVCSSIVTAPLIRAVVRQIESRRPVGQTAAEFHIALVELLVRSAVAARGKYDINTVALSGGVFQNSFLFEIMCDRLAQEEFTVLTHHQVPTNDGGLALGQIAVADAQIRQGGK